jgi:hypothetical protein
MKVSGIVSFQVGSLCSVCPVIEAKIKICALLDKRSSKSKRSVEVLAENQTLLCMLYSLKK